MFSTCYVDDDNMSRLGGGYIAVAAAVCNITYDSTAVFVFGFVAFVAFEDAVNAVRVFLFCLLLLLRLPSALGSYMEVATATATTTVVCGVPFGVLDGIGRGFGVGFARFAFVAVAVAVVYGVPSVADDTFVMTMPMLWADRASS